MKILHVARIIHEPQNGVINVVPQHLKYQSLYADVALLNIRPFTPEIKEPKKGKSIPVYYYSKYQLLDTLPDGFSTPDLVVFHEIYWPEFLKISKYFKKIGVPYIVIPHGASSKVAQKRRRAKKVIGNLMFFNSFVNSAAAIHYLSDFDKALSVFSNSRNVVQGSGIELHDERKQGFSTSGLKLIYVGRLDVVVKGIDIMLQMVKKYQTSLREHGVKITIAGSNSSGGQQIIEKYIFDNNLEDIISLEPAIFGDEKIRKILDNDLFFQLSRTEAQSLSVSEAMNLGMPTIVTPGTSFYEKAKQYNIAIPVKTKEDVYGAIKTALNDKKYLGVIGENASKYIQKNYEWHEVGRKTIQYYEKVVYGSKGIK